MRALALGICAFTGACSGSAEPTVASLRYAKASTAQQLNLYLPKGKGPFPLVIMIHGGAFCRRLSPTHTPVTVDASCQGGSLSFPLARGIGV